MAAYDGLWRRHINHLPINYAKLSEEIYRARQGVAITTIVSYRRSCDAMLHTALCALLRADAPAHKHQPKECAMGGAVWACQDGTVWRIDHTWCRGRASSESIPPQVIYRHYNI